MNAEKQIKVIAILSPGDMGHAIGRELGKRGLQVISWLSERSARTRSLAHRASIDEVDSLTRLVKDADLILSILVPAQAVDVARQVGEELARTEEQTYYADCNAVSPETVAEIEKQIALAGGRFIDASIIGAPPDSTARPRLYVSGKHARVMTQLDEKGVDVVLIGDSIGQASGIKMCYAALTKGTFALYYALAVAAQRMELLPQLLKEFEYSQPEAFQDMQKHLPKLPAKSARWVGEMKQIAATFSHTGVTPSFHNGAAEMYRLISESSLGQETPETIDFHRTLEETISAISNI